MTNFKESLIWKLVGAKNIQRDIDEATPEFARELIGENKGLDKAIKIIMGDASTRKDEALAETSEQTSLTNDGSDMNEGSVDETASAVTQTLIEETARIISDAVHDNKWDVFKKVSPLTAETELRRAKALVESQQREITVITREGLSERAPAKRIDEILTQPYVVLKAGRINYEVRRDFLQLATEVKHLRLDLAEATKRESGFALTLTDVNDLIVVRKLLQGSTTENDQSALLYLEPIINRIEGQ